MNKWEAGDFSGFFLYSEEAARGMGECCQKKTEAVEVF